MGGPRPAEWPMLPRAWRSDLSPRDAAKAGMITPGAGHDQGRGQLGQAITGLLRRRRTRHLTTRDGRPTGPADRLGRQLVEHRVGERIHPGEPALDRPDGKQQSDRAGEAGRIDPVGRDPLRTGAALDVPRPAGFPAVRSTRALASPPIRVRDQLRQEPRRAPGRLGAPSARARAGLPGPSPGGRARALAATSGSPTSAAASPAKSWLRNHPRTPFRAPETLENKGVAIALGWFPTRRVVQRKTGIVKAPARPSAVRSLLTPFVRTTSHGSWHLASI